jgi:glycosyltransferase involved in cell wall biosynthesis
MDVERLAVTGPGPAASSSRPSPGEDVDRLMTGLSIAVILPCYNEQATIASVVRDFRRHLPTADIYVYDNSSSDRTADVAGQAGAIVRREPAPGKGNVVRRMFADIDADVYVMADGDATYDAAVAPAMITQLVGDNLDMVVGTRLDSEGAGLFRRGHRLGNVMLTRFVGLLFGEQFRDMLSGYRVFSRRFAKSFPALSTGFEIETELTVHALELRMPVAEVETRYFQRPEGSVSKLNTYRDGLRILWTILFLLKELRPIYFFGAFALAFASTALVLSYPLVVTFIETGLVPRFPTAILATGLMILACLSLTCALILDNVCTGRWEAKRTTYLSIPATLASRRPDRGSSRERRS